MAATTRTSTGRRWVGADALDLAALEDAQELGLQLEAELANLVEEDGAARGRLEGAVARGDRRR